MSEVPDDFEKLLTDVRKTISDNKLFLEKLVDETTEDDSEDDSEEDSAVSPSEDAFEEL